MVHPPPPQLNPRTTTVGNMVEAVIESSQAVLFRYSTLEVVVVVVL